MRVSKAKSNPVAGVETFYVTSSSKKNVKYIVLRFALPTPLFVCECRDSFSRRLPHLGRPTYSLCKHAALVAKRAK